MKISQGTHDSDKVPLEIRANVSMTHQQAQAWPVVNEIAISEYGVRLRQVFFNQAHDPRHLSLVLEGLVLNAVLVHCVMMDMHN